MRLWEPWCPCLKVKILSDFFPLLQSSCHPSYSGSVPCQDQGLFLDHSADHSQQQQPALTAPAAPGHGKAGWNNFPSQGNVRSAVALSAQMVQLQREAAQTRQQGRESESGV